ncbi:unnamed protein product, partial [Haemonchus placei]|uniref:Amphiphysin n=1 Tax=Haemonchus placei TaxID=6290 RepID=A0A0N4XAG6_HAEPC
MILQDPIHIDREETHEMKKLSETVEPGYLTGTEEHIYWNSVWAADRPGFSKGSFNVSDRSNLGEFEERSKISPEASGRGFSNKDSEQIAGSLQEAVLSGRETDHLDTMIFPKTFPDQQQKDEISIPQWQPSLPLESWTTGENETSIETPQSSESMFTKDQQINIACVQKFAEQTSFIGEPTSEMKDAEALRPTEPTLAQEELDHIAYIQRLAEETSLAVQPLSRPAPHSVVVDEQRRTSLDVEEADIPRYAAELESEEQSEPTSGADQGVVSEAGSPALLYERESPLPEREEKPS